MPFLRLYSDEQLQEQWELTASRLRIGRASDNDVILQSPGISKHHAYIEKQGNSFVLFDNNSANGVFVNGNRVTRHTLKYRDEIQILPFKLTFMALPKLPGEEAGSYSEFSETMQENATVFVPANAINAILSRQKGEPANARAFAPTKTGSALPSRRTPQSVAYLVCEGISEPYLLDKVNFTLGRSRDNDIRCGGWFAPRVVAAIQRRHDGCYLIRGKRGQVLLNGAHVRNAARLKDEDTLLVQGLRLKYCFRPLGGRQ